MASHGHVSDSFDLAAGEVEPVPVVAGGYEDLADISNLTGTLEIAPDTGEVVRIVRTSEIEAADGMLGVQILDGEFTRGGTGTVSFTLENTGEAEIEIVTTRNSGASVSGDIVFRLLDPDENVLASAHFKQVLGDGIGIFDWTPAVRQAGTYAISFTASDGELADREIAELTIYSKTEQDGDGLADDWELRYFTTPLTGTEPAISTTTAYPTRTNS